MTDALSIASWGISDARPYFGNDSFTANRYKVALAPHIYGPVSARLQPALWPPVHADPTELP